MKHELIYKNHHLIYFAKYNETRKLWQGFVGPEPVNCWGKTEKEALMDIRIYVCMLIDWLEEYTNLDKPILEWKHRTKSTRHRHNHYQLCLYQTLYLTHRQAS